MAGSWQGTLRALTLSALTVTLGTCAAGKPGTGSEAGGSMNDELRVVGTVKAAKVGVNCWTLQGSDGTSYELRVDQAPTDVLVDGKQVTLVLRKRIDLMSTCMAGQIVDVVRVE